MRVFIDEFDKDYRTITNNFEKEFDSMQEAEEWCKEASWSGYTYLIDMSLTKAINEG
ncbi:hypothetical protein MVUOKPPV_CDS0015 [Klebsiella phage phi1_175008]|uniref:Uncharacterized protein n=2 Tax=Klebsiella phage phi1_175008 TaxID=3127744 RepID=A0ACD5FQV2_9CAUD